MTRQTRAQALAEVGEQRAVDVGDDAAQAPSEEMVSLARAMFSANKEKNKHTRDENKAKKSLAALMAQAGLYFFRFRVGTRHLTCEYSQPESEGIDVARLVDLVGAEAVLKHASISKEKVEEHFGKDVMNRCTTSKLGEWRTKVAEVKP